MKIGEKLKQKIKTDERFIAKMILTGILAVSVPTFAGGVYACHKAVKDNPTDYANDSRYIGGMIAIVTSTTLGTAGVGGCIGNDEETEPKNTKTNNRKDENNDTDI